VREKKMITQKKFKHKETGEIKTQLSIFELKNYEEIEEENNDKM